MEIKPLIGLGGVLNGLLLGEPPGSLEAELRGQRSVPRMPRNVPVGLLGTLIRRRPDVREVEARLHEATAARRDAAELTSHAQLRKTRSLCRPPGSGTRRGSSTS